MNTYQFIDPNGFVKDVVFCLDLAEAMDYAAEHDLLDCAILDRGPTSLRVWAEVAA